MLYIYVYWICVHTAVLQAHQLDCLFMTFSFHDEEVEWCQEHYRLHKEHALWSISCRYFMISEKFSGTYSYCAMDLIHVLKLFALVLIILNIGIFLY